MQNKKYVVGIDFGTTSLSAILQNTDECKIEKVYNYNTNAYIPFEEHYKKEQSLEKLGQLFDKLISQIKSLPNIEIQAYAFTGQMHGIIGLNEKGEAVTNLVTWQDKSGDLLTDKDSTILESIREKTGVNTIANGYGIVTLYKWVNLDKRTDIHSFCTAPDYFARHLANEHGEVKMNATMAHSIGLYDIHHDKWQLGLIDKLNLSSVTFPTVESNNQIIGYTDSTPIFCALGDNQASFVGSVFDKDNSVLLNVGTGTQLSFLINKTDYEEYKKYIDGFETQLRPYDDTHYLIATSFLNGGSVYKSLFNFFKDIAQNLFGITEIDEGALWQQMTVCGKASTNSSLPLDVVPMLEGQRKDPTLGGVISNLRTSNFTPGDFIAGFLKGLAVYYKTGFLESVEKHTKYICGSGNGLKKNPLFCEIIEDTFGHPLRLTAFDEEAAVGATIYACLKIGIWTEGDYKQIV